jgi:hypothetical protein
MMKPTLKTLLLGGWMVVTTLGVAALAVDRAQSSARVASFDTLDVQRINIMEPNGNPRVVIANKGHFPGAFMHGKEFGHFNRHAGGFLFFNDAGDEVGGLIFDNNVGRPGGPQAMSNLSMDQLHQDETVSLNYNREDGVDNAGLTVADRPDWAIEPLLVISDKAAHARTPAERQAAMDEIKAFARAKGPHPEGADRMFAGKQNGDALVRLSDKQGRPRLVLKVDKAGAPSIQMLDESGKVVRALTGG